jgi:hypothetical protein
MRCPRIENQIAINLFDNRRPLAGVSVLQVLELQTQWRILQSMPNYGAVKLIPGGNCSGS